MGYKKKGRKSEKREKERLIRERGKHENIMLIKSS